MNTVSGWVDDEPALWLWLNSADRTWKCQYRNAVASGRVNYQSPQWDASTRRYRVTVLTRSNCES
ncbi:MAG TPA: hypothetical protein VJM50_19430 [Pyrinomonadaceae bacterium]|nr:hypothetical protein [Pyrinomonadaceae bacterium]